jgi:hypothetical protein
VLSLRMRVAARRALSLSTNTHGDPASCWRIAYRNTGRDLPGLLHSTASIRQMRLPMLSHFAAADAR